MEIVCASHRAACAVAIDSTPPRNRLSLNLLPRKKPNHVRSDSLFGRPHPRVLSAPLYTSCARPGAQATHIIIVEPVSGSEEHAQAVEMQAIGRAYRLGQARAVSVVRFVIEHTGPHAPPPSRTHSRAPALYPTHGGPIPPLLAPPHPTPSPAPIPPVVEEDLYRISAPSRQAREAVRPAPGNRNRELALL